MSADPYEDNHRKRRRNRMRVSCLNCYASKRKCDRKRPCSRCTKHGLTGLCVYELDDPDARDPSLDEKTHLRNRIAELESVIRELNNRPHPRWFTSSGKEHLPELVAVRRSSTTSTHTDVSNITVATSTALSIDSNPTPRKASLRARTLSSSFKSQEERVSGSVKVGTKRKYEDNDSMETKNTSYPLVNAFSPSKNRSKGPRGNAGRKGHHSDASYLTDDDDDDDVDDEDYEENEPHARFRHAHRRSRPPAKHESIEKHAYTFPDRRNPSHHDSVTIASSVPASRSRSRSMSGLFSPHKDNSNAADDSSLSPITPLLPIGQYQDDHSALAVESKANNTNCQSALGLILDGSESYSNAQPQDGDEDDIDERAARPYPLRQNVVWSDGDEDSIIDKKTPAMRNTTKRIVKLTLKAKQKPQKSSKKKLPTECDYGSSIEPLDTVEDKICSSSLSPTLCPHFTDEMNRNDLASFIKVLGDTSNNLRSAHEIPKKKHTKIECELFKRIIGLNDYISSIGNVHRTQIEELPPPDVVIPNNEDFHHVPGARPGGHAPLDVETQKESPPSSTTSLIIAPLPDSATSATNRKSSTARRRRKKSRTMIEEPEPSKSLSTATVDPQPDSTRILNIPAAPLSPAPTPASILARSAFQHSVPKEPDVAGLPSTVTLATILAATMGPPQQQLMTPPRLMSTPDPTLLPTPTLSPSSPLLRSVNSAIRRPDADFLPFYSNNHHFNMVENVVEQEYNTNIQSRTLMGSFMHRAAVNAAGPGSSLSLTGRRQQDPTTRCLTTETDVSPLDAFTFSPLLNLDTTTAKIGGEVKNPSSATSVIVPVVPNTGEPGGNMDLAGVAEEMDLDVDAEGEPAPETGYEYGYFDDGYRYECVWVSET